MSDTPRTDAAKAWANERGWPSGTHPMSEILRRMGELERELSAAKAALAELEKLKDQDALDRLVESYARDRYLMAESRLAVAQKKYEDSVADRQQLWNELNEAAQRAERAEAALAGKQAKIDALMLEYCPDEMDPEQVAEWTNHQMARAFDPDIDGAM